MSIIVKVTDWWMNITNGKCRCGKKLKRNQYYCSAKCLNDSMDAVEFDEDFRDIKGGIK